MDRPRLQCPCLTMLGVSHNLSAFNTSLGAIRGAGREPPVFMQSESVSAPDFYHSTQVIDGLVVAPASAEVVKDLLAAGLSACNWTVTSHHDETLTAINKIV